MPNQFLVKLREAYESDLSGSDEDKIIPAMKFLNYLGTEAKLQGEIAKMSNDLDPVKPGHWAELKDLNHLYFKGAEKSESLILNHLTRNVPSNEARLKRIAASRLKMDRVEEYKKDFEKIKHYPLVWLSEKYDICDDQIWNQINGFFDAFLTVLGNLDRKSVGRERVLYAV